MCEQMHKIADILVAVGAINWGLVGFLNLNLVEKLDALAGGKNFIARIIYILIGIAGVYLIIDSFAPCAVFK